MPGKDSGEVNGNVIKLELSRSTSNETEISKSATTFRSIQESDIIKLNVSGIVYETLESTLKRFPDTLLGDSEKREKYHIPSRGEYFFDRNRTAFEAILYFYQTGGILIRPPTIPMRLFAEDVRFFQLGDKAFMKLQKEEGYIQDAERPLPINNLQRKIWELFEYPDTSLAARILAIWSVAVIVVSITVFCVETLPQYEKKDTGNIDEQQPWVSFEIGCIAWFTFEYLVRLFASPSKWNFLKSFLNLIDVAAILPYYITLPMNEANAAPLSVLRVIRLVRVFRIFKLSRHSVGLRILGHTLKESSRELAMLIFFLILGIILFSSAMYYAEASNRKEFPSIPDTFWYSLVTMTTVGYGDKVPKTMPGKFIGSLCAIVGVLTIALPVPVIVSNFEFFYKRDRLSYEQRQDTSEKARNCEQGRAISKGSYAYLRETNV